MLPYIISLVISIILYINAPDVYDFKFCCTCFIIFLVISFIHLLPRFKKKEYLSFDLIFLFSFFWTSFAYPVFVYGTIADRMNYIKKAVDWSHLSHTSALCLIFICAYLLGANTFKNKVEFKEIDRKGNNKYAHIKPPTFFFYLIGALFLGNTLIYQFTYGWYENVNTNMYLIDLFTISYILLLLTRSNNLFVKRSNNVKLCDFISSNLLPIISGFILAGLYIVIGDRGPAIKIILIFVFLFYYFYKKINLSRLVLYGSIAVAFLFFVRQTRTSSTPLGSGGLSKGVVQEVFTLENGPIYMFADLFGISCELCTGYDYALNNDLYYPHQRILLAPISGIPILPSVISKLLWGVTPSQIDTSRELNDYFYKSYNLESRFGTHITIDLYMSFGMLGMIIIAFLFGFIFSYIEKNKYNNIYMSACYLMLVGYSLYLPRSSILYIIRPLFFTIIIVFILYKSKKRVIKHYEKD